MVNNFHSKNWSKDPARHHESQLKAGTLPFLTHKGHNENQVFVKLLDVFPETAPAETWGAGRGPEGSR